jgi:predicted ArsR family transcriptional regulator
VTRSSPGLAAVSGLDDPVRGRLYEIVAGRSEPTGRDEAAAAAGIGRALAAYHLDKLVDLGLLTASYQRPEGRRGPGAGRPAKVYTRSAGEFAVTVPPREYELAARLLVTAIESDCSDRSQAALRDAARQFGATLGQRSQVAAAGRPTACAVSGRNTGEASSEAGGGPLGGLDPRERGAWERDAREAMEAVLREHGFEPQADEDGNIRLRNCPFHHLAIEHTQTICGMNLALIEGLAGSFGTSTLHPALEPRPGCCCVVIGTSQPAGEKPETGQP